MNKKLFKLTFTVIKAAVAGVLFFLILNIFIFATSVVQGESMLPVLEEGDRLVFNKAAYFFEDPERGDIVIIHRPIKNYVKRIIALPGETIEIKEQKLLINGKTYSQDFLTEGQIERTSDFGPVTVPNNSYFVMGDNRSISKDSRNGLGFVSEQEIIGRSELVVYPFSEFSVTR